jgi:hypothetical protein
MGASCGANWLVVGEEALGDLAQVVVRGEDTIEVVEHRLVLDDREGQAST